MAGNEGVMEDSIWVPMALAAMGTTLAFAASLLGHKTRGRGAYPIDASDDGVSSLRPRTERDSDAQERLPYLKMRNGSYRLGKVRLTLRQYDI